jgi:hypothetical protein
MSDDRPNRKTINRESDWRSKEEEPVSNMWEVRRIS